MVDIDWGEDDTQHEKALKQGKKFLEPDGEGREGHLPTDFKSRDDDIIKWSKDLAGLEFQSDQAIYWCSKLKREADKGHF